MDPQFPQPQQVPQQSFFQKYKFTIISLVVIILAAVPLLLLSNTANKPKPLQVATPTAVSPTPVPLNASNADTVLSQTDSSLQQTLNQVDTDLQQVGKIDSSQDSTSGL